MIGRSLAAVALFSTAALALPACGGNQATVDGGTATCAQDTRALQYVPNLMQAGMNGLISVTLISSNPGPPIKGNNDWSIRIADSAGNPVTGATIDVTPFMPDHGHGTPIKVGVTPMTSGGTYLLSPVNLFMAGLWQVTIRVTTADSKSDFVVFSFCIEG